jgi:hypothetical protein
MAKREPASTTPATIPAASKKSRSKYLPEMCDTIIELGKRGRSKTQAASHLGIARSTFENWLEAHEEFREAWELADTHSQAFWENIGMAGLGKGHVFNDRCWSLQMRNRWPRDYKESRELELSGVGGAPIQIVLSPADANL